jgi:hypothetical protein
MKWLPANRHFFEKMIIQAFSPPPPPPPTFIDFIVKCKKINKN